MPKPSDLKNVTSGMNYRSIPLAKRADGTPETLDDANRSVEIIVATEQPVPVIDWERYEVVPEILLMSGCQIPASRQVPMLDTHMRYNTSTVIGSCRDLRVEGNQLISRAVYSSMPEAEGPYTKMKEGHLTDYSAGYRYNKKDAVYIPEGETGIVDGRTFTGPVKVVRTWQIKEASACPIGADDLAKARAATPPAYQAVKENEMDQRLRAFLESRGLPVGATEEEAFRYLETLDVKPAAPAAPAVAGAARSEDEIRSEAILAEQSRIRDIRSICERSGLIEKADEYIRSNSSVEAVRKAAFDSLVANTPATPGHRGSIEVGADERDKFRAAGEHALLLRAGISVATLAPGANDLRGFSLSEMAREALRVSGQPFGGDKMQMIGRALTTSDFPTLLGNVANLSLMAGWDTAGETWQEWCGVGSVSDFKVHTMARAGETDDLDEIGDETEYKYGKRGEQKEEYKVVSFGKLFAISRQAIINDSLSALTDTPRAHGEAAARKVGDLPYAVLVANANMGDGKALFHTDHKNIGTTAIIKDTSIAEAIKLMKLQKDISGKRRLNIRPEFILAPATCEGAAEVFFNSVLYGSAVDATTNNPYAGNRFKRIYEPRLDDADVKKWYAAAQKGKTVNVFFLNGNQAPYLETKQGWNVDGVEMKVRIDAGAKAVDWKGLLSNAGG